MLCCRFTTAESFRDTSVCFQEKNGRKEPGWGAHRVPPGTPSSRHRYSAAGGGVVIKKKKSAAAPLRATAPSLRYHLAPGVHVSSLPTLLNPSSFTGYDRRAGRTSLFIGFARRPSLSYWFQRSPLDAISPLSCADGLGWARALGLVPVRPRPGE